MGDIELGVIYCTHQPFCPRRAMDGVDYCYAHQPKYVERCERGEHDLCFEDGLTCCTCGMVKGAEHVAVVG